MVARARVDPTIEHGGSNDRTTRPRDGRRQATGPLSRRSVDMTITLYHGPGTRSGRVKKLLDVLELPYELRLVDSSGQEHKRPEYLALNPFGVLPTLVHDGRTILESGAQMLYLADLVPDRGLAPAPVDPARATYYEWFVLTAATFEPAAMAHWADPGDEPARARFAQAMRIMEDRIAMPYCMSHGFCAVDILVHWNLQFVLESGVGQQLTKARTYFDAHRGRLDWDGY